MTRPGWPTTGNYRVFERDTRLGNELRLLFRPHLAAPCLYVTYHASPFTTTIFFFFSRNARFVMKTMLSSLSLSLSTRYNSPLRNIFAGMAEETKGDVSCNESVLKTSPLPSFCQEYAFRVWRRRCLPYDLFLSHANPAPCFFLSSGFLSWDVGGTRIFPREFFLGRLL